MFAKAGYRYANGQFPGPSGARLASIKRRTGYVSIAALHPDWRPGLLDAAGPTAPDGRPAFQQPRTETEAAAELNAIIEAWTRQRTSGRGRARTAGETFRAVRARVRRPGRGAERSAPAWKRCGHEPGSIQRLGQSGAIGMGLPIQFSKSTVQFDQPGPRLGSANEQITADLLDLLEARHR